MLYYLDHASRTKRFFMLNEHPSQRCSNLRAKQSLAFLRIKTELRPRPERDVFLDTVLIHQSLQRDRPGSLVFHVQEQEILESRHRSLRPTAQLGVLKKQHVGVLCERDQFTLDVLVLCFVARRVDVVGNDQTGSYVDCLVVHSFRSLFETSEQICLW